MLGQCFNLTNDHEKIIQRERRRKKKEKESLTLARRIPSPTPSLAHMHSNTLAILTITVFPFCSPRTKEQRKKKKVKEKEKLRRIVWKEPASSSYLVCEDDSIEIIIVEAGLSILLLDHPDVAGNGPDHSRLLFTFSCKRQQCSLGCQQPGKEDSIPQKLTQPSAPSHFSLLL